MQIRLRLSNSNKVGFAFLLFFEIIGCARLAVG